MVNVATTLTQLLGMVFVVTASPVKSDPMMNVLLLLTSGNGEMTICGYEANAALNNMQRTSLTPDARFT